MQSLGKILRSSQQVQVHCHLHFDPVAQRKKGVNKLHSQQQFGQWAVRTGFYLLAAAAFVSSLSLLVLREDVGGGAGARPATTYRNAQTAPAFHPSKPALKPSPEARGGGGDVGSYRTLEAEERAWLHWRKNELAQEEGRHLGLRGFEAAGALGMGAAAKSAAGGAGALQTGGNETQEAEFKAWVDGLLNTSVPILLGKRALRSKDAFSCGGTHVVKFKLYKDMRSISHLADVLPEHDLLTTPGKPLDKKYESCAVVGNSGSLLETQYGDMVDNHDVVIRFNAAKTEGYEQFVGAKTTFRLLNSVDMDLKRESSSNEASITTLRNIDYKEWAKKVQASGNPATWLTTDPEFLCHCWAWVRNRGDKPSSGLVGIVMALKMCNKVDIYGFQYSNYFSRFSRPHYYDWERPKKGREKVHPFTREVALYAQLAKLGFLKVW